MLKKVCFLFTEILLLVSLFCSCTTGANVLISKDDYTKQVSSSHETERIPVVINKNSDIYHLDKNCVYAKKISPNNKLEIGVESLAYLETHGYKPCAWCAETKSPT